MTTNPCASQSLVGAKRLAHTHPNVLSGVTPFQWTVDRFWGWSSSGTSFRSWQVNESRWRRARGGPQENDQDQCRLEVQIGYVDGAILMKKASRGNADMFQLFVPPSAADGGRRLAAASQKAVGPSVANPVSETMPGDEMRSKAPLVRAPGARGHFRGADLTSGGLEASDRRAICPPRLGLRWWSFAAASSARCSRVHPE